MLNWIPPVIIACLFIGTMSGVAGILPKSITPPIFLFIVGATWLPYYASIIFFNGSKGLLAIIVSFFLFSLWMASKFLATLPGITGNYIALLLFCGFLSAIGNHGLFTAVKLAGKYSGFPLVAFSMQSIVALFVSLLFVTGGAYAIQFSGLETAKAGLLAMNAKHWIAIALGLGSVLFFQIAGPIK